MHPSANHHASRISSSRIVDGAGAAGGAGKKADEKATPDTEAALKVIGTASTAVTPAGASTCSTETAPTAMRPGKRTRSSCVSDADVFARPRSGHRRGAFRQ